MTLQELMVLVWSSRIQCEADADRCKRINQEIQALYDRIEDLRSEVNNLEKSKVEISGTLGAMMRSSRIRGQHRDHLANVLGNIVEKSEKQAITDSFVEDIRKMAQVGLEKPYES